MRYYSKKIAAVLMLSFMAATVLATGCGKKEETQETTDVVTTQEVTTEEVTTAEETTEETTVAETESESETEAGVDFSKYVGTWYASEDHNGDVLCIKSVETYYYEDMDVVETKEGDEATGQQMVFNLYQAKASFYIDTAPVFGNHETSAAFTEEVYDSDEYIRGELVLGDNEVSIRVTESTAQQLQAGDVLTFSYYSTEIDDHSFSTHSDTYLLHYMNYNENLLDVAEYIDQWDQLAKKLGMSEGSHRKTSNSLEEMYVAESDGYAEIDYETINGVKHFAVHIPEDLSQEVRFGNVWMGEVLDKEIDNKMRLQGYSLNDHNSGYREYVKTDGKRKIYVQFSTRSQMIEEMDIDTDYEEVLKKVNR